MKIIPQWGSWIENLLQKCLSDDDPDDADDDDDCDGGGDRIGDESPETRTFDCGYMKYYEETCDCAHIDIRARDEGCKTRVLDNSVTGMKNYTEERLVFVSAHGNTEMA